METGSDKLKQVIAFHGHYCPGLAIGYRAAQIAMRELGAERSEDEELVAICDTDACGVDAIQYLTGCTLGKGNLIVRDWGKQVFTLGRRTDGKMVRVALRHGAFDQVAAETPEEARRNRIDHLHSQPEAKMFDVHWVEREIPGNAQIFKSVRCVTCGEDVMEPRARVRDGEPICPECYGEVYRRCL
jgi:formylmethanofuran dehydrogenase subunit E